MEEDLPPILVEESPPVLTVQPTEVTADLPVSPKRKFSAVPVLALAAVLVVGAIIAYQNRPRTSDQVSESPPESLPRTETPQAELDKSAEITEDPPEGAPTPDESKEVAPPNPVTQPTPSPEIKSFSQGVLVRTRVAGHLLWHPRDWTYKVEQNADGTETHRWISDTNGAYVKLDISNQADPDLATTVGKFAHVFETSSRYQYRLVRWRTGEEAAPFNLVWNFRISKDGEQMNRRTIAYWNQDGHGYALLLNSREDGPSYAEFFDQILQSREEF